MHHGRRRVATGHDQIRPIGLSFRSLLPLSRRRLSRPTDVLKPATASTLQSKALLVPASHMPIELRRPATLLPTRLGPPWPRSPWTLRAQSSSRVRHCACLWPACHDCFCSTRRAVWVPPRDRTSLDPGRKQARFGDELAGVLHSYLTRESCSVIYIHEVSKAQ